MLISVITATRNRKHYLADALASVQQSILVPLTGVNFEHIVYDDGSEDGTESLFTSNPYPRVSFFRSEKHIGQSRARNNAIKQSSGEYIFVLDDDDVILQRTLCYFAEAAQRAPHTQWFTADFLRTDEHLKYASGDDYYGWTFDSPAAMLESIFRAEHFIQHNIFFRRELFDRVGGYDENLNRAVDLDLCIRFLRAGYLPQYCKFISHLHRFHGTNLSKGMTLAEHQKTITLLKQKYP